MMNIIIIVSVTAALLNDTINTIDIRTEGPLVAVDTGLVEDEIRRIEEKYVTLTVPSVYQAERVRKRDKFKQAHIPHSCTNYL